MSTPGFALGFSEVAQNQRQKAADKSTKERDEREAKLQTLLNSGLPPAQVQQGIRDIYGQDAPALQRHVENLFRRVAGKQPQAAQAPMRAADLAGLEAQGTTPEQRRTQEFKAETDYQNQAALDFAQKQRAQQAEEEQKRIFGLIDQYIPDPEANKTAKEEYARRQAGIVQKFSNIPGAGGQPYKTPNGTWVRPVQTADGSIVEQPMPAGYTGPAAKPVAINREYADLYAKALMARQGGPPLTAEESAKMQADYHAMVDAGVARMAALAQAQAASNVVDATDPNTGASVKVTRQQAIAAANAGQPYGASALSTPGQAEKNRQDFANSGLLQIQTMRGILKRHPEFFGPAGGRGTKLAAWVGSIDPDAQAFRTAALILADHSAGVFGGRSVRTVQELQQTITDLNLSAPAILSGLDVDEGTFRAIAPASGRLPFGTSGQASPAPRNTGGTGTKHKVGDTIVQGGHKFKVTAVDANGKVTAANPQ